MKKIHLHNAIYGYQSSTWIISSSNNWPIVICGADSSTIAILTTEMEHLVLRKVSTNIVTLRGFFRRNQRRDIL